MKNNTTKEVISSTGLIVIAVFLLNPFHFWMPNMMVMSMLVAALVLFGLFASFILREKTHDERDVVHQALAGRNAFVTGAAILIIGIVVQGYFHMIDSWLVITLVVMIIAKITTRIWSDRNY